VKLEKTSNGETEATAGTLIEFTVAVDTGYTGSITTTPDTGAHTTSHYSFSMPPNDVVIHVKTKATSSTGGDGVGGVYW
jgi:hypothetical protein